MKHILIGKDAAQELEEAAAWYEKNQTGLGLQLIDAFDQAVRLLGEPNPPLTTVEGVAGEKGAQKLILHKFPFSVIVYEMERAIVVVALSHHSRKPGYWKSRVEL